MLHWLRAPRGIRANCYDLREEPESYLARRRSLWSHWSRDLLRPRCDAQAAAAVGRVAVMVGIGQVASANASCVGPVDPRREH